MYVSAQKKLVETYDTRRTKLGKQVVPLNPGTGFRIRDSVSDREIYKIELLVRQCLEGFFWSCGTESGAYY
jgi:hypothetical protein